MSEHDRDGALEDEITSIHALGEGRVGETEADVEAALQRLEERVIPYLGAEGAASFVAEYRSPDALAVGTPSQIVDRLAGMQSRGMDYGILYFPDAAYDRSGIELFEREVLPALS